MNIFKKIFGKKKRKIEEKECWYNDKHEKKNEEECWYNNFHEQKKGKWREAVDGDTLSSKNQLDHAITMKISKK